mmetsp:Transcript_30151/g.66855  ORF Transcript_30151/g.66855 Transcript_30151/m.66855 type:complete len:114 (-) Transcript_30151:492-833(-)
MRNVFIFGTTPSHGKLSCHIFLQVYNESCSGAPTYKHPSTHQCTMIQPHAPAPMHPHIFAQVGCSSVRKPLAPPATTGRPYAALSTSPTSRRQAPLSPPGPQQHWTVYFTACT